MKYLSANRIKASVEALSNTRGKAALLDFLIVKRTLAILGTKSAAITQGEAAYLRATRDMAGVWDKKKIEIGVEREIFNVFASHDSKNGFRSGKYISNGTGSTIGGNTWQAVLELSQDSPRKASFREGYEDHLETLLLKSGKMPKPNLADLAIWNYRYADIEPFLAGDANPTSRPKRLEYRFIEEYGLTREEINILFDTSGAKIADDDLAEVVADPANFLVGLAPSAAQAPISEQLCSLDLVAALAAKPFVILTGTSGTGKSRSTLSFAEKLQTFYGSQVEGQIFQLVAIGPDWTSPKKLLGYRTPFGQMRKRADGSETNESYEITETLRIILRACHPLATKIPHFLVFDEMNLSHVERYFAPFLSLMEAANILDDGENAPIVDRHSLAVVSELLDLEDFESPEAESARLLYKNEQPLELPPNLFYVGTVNIDETTYMFSPKVLDRAHVLEVRALSPSQYVQGGADGATIGLAQANELLREAIDDRELSEFNDSNPAAVVDLLSSKHGVDPDELRKAKELTLKALDGCFVLLGPVGFEFGFRVVKEVHGYMLVWIKAQIAMGLTPAAAMAAWIDGLDRAIFQKVLPKIHGNRSALGESLKALAAFLDGGDASTNPAAKYAVGAGPSVQIEPKQGLVLPTGKSFTLSRAKLLDMHERLVARNYVSFVK